MERNIQAEQNKYWKGVFLSLLSKFWKNRQNVLKLFSHTISWPCSGLIQVFFYFLPSNTLQNAEIVENGSIRLLCAKLFYIGLILCKRFETLSTDTPYMTTLPLISLFQKTFFHIFQKILPQWNKGNTKINLWRKVASSYLECYFSDILHLLTCWDVIWNNNNLSYQGKLKEKTIS